MQEYELVCGTNGEHMGTGAQPDRELERGSAHARDKQGHRRAAPLGTFAVAGGAFRGQLQEH
jgi:hypothetical protein